MKILVVSGFLGAGKTTFIKTLIAKSKKPLVVLENEYGQTDLDSKEIGAADGESLNVMEFMEGCVCCSQKDTFANSLIAISASLDPEYLVVEPTGVGKLGNILANVNRVTWEKIELLRPVVIVSPRGFFSNMNEYPGICTDQIKNASYIVYSCIENADEEELLPVTNEIKKINPDAEILDRPYQKMDESWFLGLLCEADSDRTFYEDEKEEVIDQYSIKNMSLRSPSDLIVLLENIIHGRLGGIVRAKGLVSCEQVSLRFDVANGMYNIIDAEAIDEAKEEAQCVFIGSNIDKDGVDRFFVFDEAELMRREQARSLEKKAVKGFRKIR